MKRALIAAFALIAAPAAAQAPTSRPVARLDATLSGQPIVAPPGRLHVTVTETTLPAKSRLPVHKHPYARVVQVLEGRLRITNLDTGQVREAAAGDWLVDAVDQWHDAVALGSGPVRLIAIDQAPPGAQVTIPRNP